MNINKKDEMKLEEKRNGGERSELATASCSAYIPKVGDAIYARRIRRSKIYHNMVIGPVVDTWDNACRVVTNPETEIEGDFQLHYNEWSIRPLFTEKFPPPNAKAMASPLETPTDTDHE